MKILQTPDEQFENLIDYPFEPKYLNVDELRIHYVDEGSNDDEVVLLMHGEPSWSFLYRHMIPPLVKAGYRVLAPDLVGFGRSDKPSEQNDHTYGKHVEWMTKWMISLDLKNITLFCQDWGSLIGLRLAAENQERFKRIVISNGGLPTGMERMSKAFLKWQEFSKTAKEFDVGRVVQGGTASDLSSNIIKGYNAPFPDDTYKAGPRIMPSLVPTTKQDPETKANKAAWGVFYKWEKPLLTAFGDSDPITRGAYKPWRDTVPGAKGQNHTLVEGGGHFVQEDKGPELAEIIIQFIQNNP